jgi:hypothetical protein
MLADRYTPEDVFARVPEVAKQTDPMLKTLDQLLEDDQLYRQVRDPGAPQQAWPGGEPPSAGVWSGAAAGGQGSGRAIRRHRGVPHDCRGQAGRNPGRRHPLRGTLGARAHPPLEARLLVARGHRWQDCEFEEGLWLAQKRLSWARRHGMLAGSEGNSQ